MSAVDLRNAVLIANTINTFSLCSPWFKIFIQA